MSSIERFMLSDCLSPVIDPLLLPGTAAYEKLPGREDAVVYFPSAGWNADPVCCDLAAIVLAKHRYYRLSDRSSHIQEFFDHPTIFEHEDPRFLKYAAELMILPDEFNQAAAVRTFETAADVASAFGCSENMALLRFSCGDGPVLLKLIRKN